MENKFCSFMPSEFRKMQISNTNRNSINKLIDFENVGEQIDVREYLNFNSGYYLGTISCMNNIIYDEASGEMVSPDIYNESSKKLKKGDVIISRNASLGKISYVNNDSKIILNGGLSYLRFIEKHKWYVMGFFVINYGSEYLTCITSGGGTQQNAKRHNVLELEIPFPTDENKNPEDVEKLVSIIVKNILNKEEQIKIKNKQIDELIVKELKDNQKNKKFRYIYPRFNEMMEETRFDTGIYEKEFKENNFLISNYENGYSYLDDFVLKFYSGSTPKYFEKENGEYPYFIRPTEYNNQRVYTSLRKINFNKNVKKYRVDKIEGIILPRKGGTNTILKPRGFNVLIGDSVKFTTFKDINVHFLASFLSSELIKFQLERIKSKTNGGSLTESNLRRLLIPNFSDLKQEKIAKIYYNEQDKITNLTLANYFEREKLRNSKVGIFQLNMEIFTLRENLENLIHKIIIEEKIEINLIY